MTARVFQVNQEQAYLNIIIGSSLEWTNNLYNEKNIKNLSDDELNQATKSDVPFFDRWSMRKYDQSLSDTGTYLTLLSLGSTVLLNSWDEPYTWDNLLVLSEILVVQSTLNGWSKSLTQRKRPYVYDDNADQEFRTDNNARLSFYSRHTSTAFAVAVYGHYYQYHTAGNIYLITSSYGLAAFIGMSRIFAGEHFFSDVVTGAVIGSLTSYLLCRSHRSALIRTLHIGHNSLSLQFKF
jgi:hypothetical protein